MLGMMGASPGEGSRNDDDHCMQQLQLVAEFDRPLLLPWACTEVTLVLHGASQAFTGGGDEAGMHYVCISYVGVQGMLLLEGETSSSEHRPPMSHSSLVAPPWQLPEPLSDHV